MTSRVAVIMSVYHSDEPSSLVDAIESILKQTTSCDLYIYQDGEVSVELLDVIKFYSRFDNVFCFSNSSNKGLASALNFLIDYSNKKGYDYIARMDSDDISHPSRIKKQVDFLNINLDVDVLGTSCREFGASFAIEEKHLPKTHEELLNFSITRCPFIHPSVMFRSSIFDSGHRYPVNTTLTEDMALWFLLLNDNVRFANLNEVLLDYRLNENTINRRRGLKKALSEINIRIHNMILLKQVNLKNFLLIISRVFFHLMPRNLIKLAYKNLR